VIYPSTFEKKEKHKNCLTYVATLNFFRYLSLFLYHIMSLKVSLVGMDHTRISQICGLIFTCRCKDFVSKYSSDRM